MTDRTSPNAIEIASHLDHASNATEANRATNELRESVQGMSRADSLQFLRSVVSAERAINPGHRHGVNVALTTDLTHVHIDLNSPYTASTSTELDDFKPQSDQLRVKPELTPGRVADDLSRVHSPADANAAWQELQTATAGLDLTNTVAFLRRAAELDHSNQGAHIALVVGDQGQAQIEFTNPYTQPMRGDLTDDSKSR